MPRTNPRESAEVPTESLPQFPEPATAKPDTSAPRYRVSGTQSVFGSKPGEIVRLPADIATGALRALVGNGYIALDTDGPGPEQEQE